MLMKSLERPMMMCMQPMTSQMMARMQVMVAQRVVGKMGLPKVLVRNLLFLMKLQ